MVGVFDEHSGILLHDRAVWLFGRSVEVQSSG